NSDVWIIFSGDQCVDSDVLEQVCAGVFGYDLEGGVFRGAGAGGVASAVWVFWESGKEVVLPDGPPARRAATSWRVYRSWRCQLLWSSRWSGGRSRAAFVPEGGRARR